MPEQWEHMAIRSYWQPAQTWERKAWMTVHTPDGDVERAGDDGTVGDNLVLLNRLGREGWQLVSTEVDEGSNYTLRTLWLRRPLS